jgi:AraC-like DNA-binding protein
MCFIAVFSPEDYMRTSKFTDEKNFKCLEDLRETSSELSLIHFGSENCMPNHVFAGIRDEFIIHFILSGHGFYSCERNIWPLTQGQMFLVRPGDSVVYCSDSRDPWSYVWFGFKGTRAKSLLAQSGFSRDRLTLPFMDGEAFAGVINEMLQHNTLTPADTLFRESGLYRLFSLLAANAESIPSLSGSEPDRSAGSQYVSQAVDYINANYMHAISVTDIADHVGISRTYLNRLFHQVYNSSVQDFLMNYKLDKAAFLLVNTEMPVKEISQNAGYRDPLVFSKAFKTKYDVSPKNYRAFRQSLELREERPLQAENLM